MNYNLLLFLLFVAGKSVSQESNYDYFKNNYDRLYKEMKHDSALVVAKQMKSWVLKNDSDTSLRYGISLRSIGNSFHKLNKIDSAIHYLTFSKKTLEKQQREEHAEYAFSLQSLGNLYQTICDYKSAEPFYEKALEVTKKALGEKHQKYAVILSNLGSLYYYMGDYKNSELNYKKALEIIKNSLGEENISFASSLNNLGILFMKIRDYKSAESCYEKAIEIIKKVLGERHPSYALGLNNLGVMFMVMGDYKTAESYYKQSLEINKKNKGDETPDYARSLYNLGTLYDEMRDYKAAEFFYKQALEIRKKVLGERHPDFISTLNSYAYLLLKTNREQEAYIILNNNLSQKVKKIADNFEWLNDIQKEVYWKKESTYFDKLFWFANVAAEKVPEVVGLNYNVALVTKSRLLETKISSDNFGQDYNELKEQLSYKNRIIIKLESDGTTEKERLEQLHHEADSLDKLLTLNWPQYAQQKKNLSITWEQVQQNLEKGEAAIEFVRFKNEDDSLYYYNALIIRKEDINTQLVKLCKEKDLQNIQPKLGFSAYYPLIWKPMEFTLKDVKTIYYSPSGELYNIPFHAIYAPKICGDEIAEAQSEKRSVKIVSTKHINTEQNAEYLMDRFELHQLTSTRYLAMNLKQNTKETIDKSIALIGGVNYDYLPSENLSPKKNKKNRNSSRSSISSNGKLKYLEGTKLETEQISESISINNWISNLYENNSATEDNIIKLEGKDAKAILHIATHGYAFPEYDFNDTLINKNSLQYSYRYSTNPMVRSGLILAGGNWAWTGSDTLSKLGAEQNGILTALEVSQLNLKKTKLVVLSACETGLGKIEGSEGTFGLKRGFKLAGVEQIIVSLWSVPDKETMELMTLFYSDLAKTLNPVISFEKAQKEMHINYPTEPEKWAGFVLVR